jgi:iron complex outermembrane receptor protein
VILRSHRLARVSAVALAAGLCSAQAAAAAQEASAASAAPAASTATPATSNQPEDQSAPATGTSPSVNSAAGADIVITAQKRSESVQRVPISVAAFSGETLLKSNVLTVADLPKLASNFQTNKGVQSTYLRVAIRGIGAASNTAIEPSVAIFVDGIYVPRAGAIVSNLLDMERIEVLRGPQGTLFGRNASVGALSLVTAVPKNETSARITGEAGTGNRYKLDGYVNIPLSDHAAFRVAALHQWFKGYWHNKLDGKTYGGHDDTQARASFRLDSGPIEWIARADFTKTTGNGMANLDFDANSVSAVQLARLKAGLGGNLPDTNTNDNVMNQFVTANLNDRQWGLSSTLNWSIGDSTLKLIDSYRDWKNDQLDGDVIFTPAKITSRTGVYDSRSQNHELQFISPKRQWLDGHLDLVAGLYYFGETYGLEEHLHMNAQYCNVLVAPVGGPPTNRDKCNAFLGTVGGHDAANQFVDQSVHSYAAYAQSDIHLSDEIYATLGGRYTKDKKNGSYLETVSNPFIVPFRAPESVTFPDLDQGRFTYRLGLNYTPTKDLLFFSSYSTGYKSGGYNSGGGSPALTQVRVPGSNPPRFISDPTRRVFGPESVGDWELGAKTSWLQHALTANLTFYRMDISGYQDRSFDGTSFTVRNVGNLRQQGFEFDGIARPIHNLALFASLAYLDSAFTNYPNAAGLPGCAPVGGAIPALCNALPNQGQFQDLKGKPATFSPKWSGRVGLDWTGDLGRSGLSWDATTNLSFFSKQYVGLVTDANPQTIQPGYAILGARVSLSGRGDRWTVALFGDNLLDKQYSAGDLYQVLDGPLGLRNGVFTGSTAIRPLHAEPRTVGASLTFRY